MSDQAKTSVPWDQPGQKSGSPADTEKESGDDNLVQVVCPSCSQALSLDREFLGEHCLCSTCDGLMLVSLRKTAGGQRTIVTEMVDKDSGEKMAHIPPSFRPDERGASMDKETKPVKPWPNEFKNPVGDSETGRQSPTSTGNDAVSEGGSTANLLQVPCPDCGQVLALGREILGSHCLCSVCDGLMLISLKKSGGGKMAVVAEKVDKITGEIVRDVPSTSSPETGGEAMEEAWENTRPVKMWAGNPGADDDDELDLGVTMPVPKMDAKDDMDLGTTMPVPGIAGSDDDMDLGATMPVPLKSEPSGKKEEVDDDWAMTDPVRSRQQAQGEPPQSQTSSQAGQAQSSGGGLPWEKTDSGRQGVKLAPPGAKWGRFSGKAPPPTSGAVPTVTTPPTKAPPPTTGSVPTLDSGMIAARAANRAQQPSPGGGQPPWQPPGAKAPIGQSGPQAPQAGKAAGKKSDQPEKATAEKKKSDPFGNKPSAPPAKKKPQRRHRKGRKGLAFVVFLFLFIFVGLALFIIAPGLIPRGLEARAFIRGKIDEAKEKLENTLAERAMNRDVPADPPSGAVIGEAVSPGTTADPKAGQGSATSPVPVQTRESDLALQKLLKQDGERVIHRFYGASSVEEKLAFVVDPDKARPDMEEYFAGREGMATVRSILFRGGTRDLETGYYYGVFDVVENENDVPHRWCVVDAGTGLYQLDWILYRQIVASELGGFLANPSPEGVTKRFHMLLKLDGNVPADDSPWFDEAVSVELQVPLISSAWYPVLMKKSLAESTGLTTKLMGGKMVIAVVEVAWVPGDKDPGKTTPAITAIKRWGAWERRDF